MRNYSKATSPSPAHLPWEGSDELTIDPQDEQSSNAASPSSCGGHPAPSDPREKDPGSRHLCVALFLSLSILPESKLYLHSLTQPHLGCCCVLCNPLQDKERTMTPAADNVTGPQLSALCKLPN